VIRLREPFRPDSEFGERALADMMTGKISAKGPMAEAAMEFMLLAIGTENTTRIAANQTVKPLTDWALFSALKGTELDGYAVVATVASHEPKKWRDVLKPLSSTTAIDPSIVLCNVDCFMRPDLIVVLRHINPSHPERFAVCTVGSRCYNVALPTANFCDNLLTTDLSRLFTNETGEELGSADDREAFRLFEKTFQGPRLRLLFIFGGVNRNVDLRKRYWEMKDGAGHASHCLLVDHSDEKSLDAVLPQSLIAALKLATAGSAAAASPARKARSPEDALQLYLAGPPAVQTLSSSAAILNPNVSSAGVSTVTTLPKRKRKPRQKRS